MDEHHDNESLDFMYSELVRINNELIQMDESRISRANNIIIFNGAIISILILAPFNLFDTFKNPIIFLFIIPSIFFCISLYYSLELIRFRSFKTINASTLVEEYWNCPKEEIMSQVVSNLENNINDNYYLKSEDKNNNVDYKKFLDKSLNFIKWGMISSIIVAILIFLSSCHIDKFFYELLISLL